VVGVVLAVTTRNKLPVKEKFLWEKSDFNASEDAFMQQFDENGNFFEIIRDEEE
jgi:hypothetical protein